MIYKRICVIVLVLLCTFFVPIRAWSDSECCSEAGPFFFAGDVNSDGYVNVADAIFLLNFIFLQGSAPEDVRYADVNADGQVNIADVIRVLGYLFGGQEAPPAVPIPEETLRPMLGHVLVQEGQRIFVYPKHLVEMNVTEQADGTVKVILDCKDEGPCDCDRVILEEQEARYVPVDDAATPMEAILNEVHNFYDYPIGQEAVVVEAITDAVDRHFPNNNTYIPADPEDPEKWHVWQVNIHSSSDIPVFLRWSPYESIKRKLFNAALMSEAREDAGFMFDNGDTTVFINDDGQMEYILHDGYELRKLQALIQNDQEALQAIDSESAEADRKERDQRLDAVKSAPRQDVQETKGHGYLEADIPSVNRFLIYRGFNVGEPERATRTITNLTALLEYMKYETKGLVSDTTSSLKSSERVMEFFDSYHQADFNGGIVFLCIHGGSKGDLTLFEVSGETEERVKGSIKTAGLEKIFPSIQVYKNTRGYVSVVVDSSEVKKELSKGPKKDLVIIASCYGWRNFIGDGGEEELNKIADSVLLSKETKYIDGAGSLGGYAEGIINGSKGEVICKGGAYVKEIFKALTGFYGDENLFLKNAVEKANLRDWHVGGKRDDDSPSWAEFRTVFELISEEEIDLVLTNFIVRFLWLTDYEALLQFAAPMIPLDYSTMYSGEEPIMTPVYIDHDYDPPGVGFDQCSHVVYAPDGVPDPVRCPVELDLPPVGPAPVWLSERALILPLAIDHPYPLWEEPMQARISVNGERFFSRDNPAFGVHGRTHVNGPPARLGPPNTQRGYIPFNSPASDDTFENDWAFIFFKESNWWMEQFD